LDATLQDSRGCVTPGAAPRYVERMRPTWSALAVLAVSFVLTVVTVGCREDSELVGQPCDVPGDCYPGLDTSLLSGPVECLTKVPGGYCTHLCEVDTDCCATEGECVAGYPQVCAPFENQPDKRCFLTCEDSELDGLDANEYCRRYAHPDFGCRSTGGGSENRKVCVP
jgi:hypothetical protein